MILVAKGVNGFGRYYDCVCFFSMVQSFRVFGIVY